MYRFEKFDIWHEAIAYAKDIYTITEQMPKSEEFGLKSQLKRAALSISSNIAEGSGCPSVKEFSHFLDIAIRSCLETVSQTLFSYELQYITEEEKQDIYVKGEILVKRMQAFKQAINRKGAKLKL